MTVKLKVILKFTGFKSFYCVLCIPGVYLIAFSTDGSIKDAGRYRQASCFSGSLVCFPWIFINSVGGSTLVQATSRFGNNVKQAVGGNAWMHRPWAVAGK